MGVSLRSRFVRRSFALLLAIAGLAAVLGCSGQAGPTCQTGSGTNGCTRVLFLGNSYTYVNDLPGTFARLAQAGGHAVEVASVANGGETLSEHAAAAESLDKIDAGLWSFVVLQEQSDMPASSAGAELMYSAAKTLSDRARNRGAGAMLFLTPAHRDGEPSMGLSYEQTQVAINATYESVARSLGDPVAPVGFVWYIVHKHHPDYGLWQSDGSHPEKLGTYLDACVFYAAIFGQSPVGLSNLGYASDDQARVIQQAVKDNVLDLAGQWGLP